MHNVEIKKGAQSCNSIEHPTDVISNDNNSTSKGIKANDGSYDVYEAVDHSFNHVTHGMPSAVYIYKDINVNDLLVQCRFDTGDGKKFSIHSYVDNKWQRGKHIMGNAPLYNLPHFAIEPEKPLLFVEGEKAAEQVKQLSYDYISTTTIQGSNSPHKSDFSPVKGRVVYICPDNDDNGRDYADKVAEFCIRHGASEVYIIDYPPAEFEHK